MEQGRVIDSLYGSISGRDKSFKYQFLSLVDIHKEHVMNQLVNYFNPNAWKTDDSNPTGQVPHIQSSYCNAFGTELGLRGVKAAKLDRDKITISDQQKEKLITSFKRLFSVSEIITVFIADVNQQNENSDRLINRESLMKWAGEENGNGFDAHSIYYDETQPERWSSDLGKPDSKNIYYPFLCHSVALNILNQLFLVEKK